MKKHWLITAAMLVALSANAWGNSNPTPPTPPLATSAAPAMSPMTPLAPAPVATSPAPADPAPLAPATQSAPALPAPLTDTAPQAKPSKKYHQYTLEEARKKAHEKADKLDKMTEEEFQAEQKKKHDHYVMWKHMTPEEKAEYKKAHPWHKGGASATTSSDTSAPAAGGQ